MSSELEAIRPTRAVEMYIRSRENELAQATIYSHRSRLNHFTEWFDTETEYEHVRELSGIDIHEYRLWRREHGDPGKVTMKTQIDTLRVFIRWCESIDAVTQDLSVKVLSPTLDKGDNVRSEMLDAESAEAILDDLDRYEYASHDHVTLLLLYRCLLRRGAVRAIDLDDVVLNGDEKRIEINHRPDTGTPLKNQGDGERVIAITDETAQVLRDHIDRHRHDVEDDHGREPLLTTAQGRPHRTTIQARIYAVTRPCNTGGECPHGRDEADCAAAKDRQSAYQCPSSLSPHPVRRGAITHWLQSDVPETAVGDRADADPSILSTHYDQRTERQKSEQRRKYLDDV